MALYFECRINKNALLQAAFSILPTGFAIKSLKKHITIIIELFTKILDVMM